MNEIETAKVIETTMIFESGVHTWELIFPVCLNNVEFGVRSKLSNKNHFRKFRTTTPRYVALTLDVEAKKLLYRLNKDPSTDKTIYLDSDGPFVPYVNCTKSEVEVVLNPYPRLQDNQKTMVNYLFLLLIKFLWVLSVNIFDF